MGAPVEVSIASIMSRLCTAGRRRYQTAAPMRTPIGTNVFAGARYVAGSRAVPRGHQVSAEVKTSPRPLDEHEPCHHNQRGGEQDTDKFQGGDEWPAARLR
jgi:hypothetical protein